VKDEPKKKCSRCHGLKPLADFYKNKNGKLGRGHRCIACTKKYQREFTPAQVALRKATSKRWYEENKKELLVRMRECSLWRAYKITQKDYERILEDQNFKCAICLSNEPGRRLQNYFSIDHCHDTGRIRGLLCDQCNKGLGHFRDNVLFLKSAIEYLQRSQPVPDEVWQLTQGPMGQITVTCLDGNERAKRRKR